jgi:WD40 repeat protein
VLGLTDDGRILITGGTDGSVVAWDITKRKRRTIDSVQLEQEVLCVDLAQDTGLVATATGDSRAQVWSLTAHA